MISLCTETAQPERACDIEHDDARLYLAVDCEVAVSQPVAQRAGLIVTRVPVKLCDMVDEAAATSRHVGRGSVRTRKDGNILRWCGERCSQAGSKRENDKSNSHDATRQKFHCVGQS
jgi:hypothetical protein